MQFLWMGLMVAGIVAADQVTKLLTVQNIPLYGHQAAIPGLFGLTYTQNTGAAWSSFQGMIWLFALIFALFAAFLVWEFATGKFGFSKFEHWCLAAVFGGGLGNMIDRLRLGYVVDMIELQFMDFPIFNVADCPITCGCIALIVSLIFFNKSFWKDDKK